MEPKDLGNFENMVIPCPYCQQTLKFDRKLSDDAFRYVCMNEECQMYKKLNEKKGKNE